MVARWLTGPGITAPETTTTGTGLVKIVREKIAPETTATGTGLAKIVREKIAPETTATGTGLVITGPGITAPEKIVPEITTT